MGVLRRDRRIAYSVAVALPVVVTLLCMLAPHPRHSIWPALATLYMAVVVVLAVWVGWSQAIVSLVEGALLLDYYFIGPPHSLFIPNSSDAVVFSSFVLMGLLIAAAIGWRRSNEKRLQVALSLMQGQAALSQTRAASDISTSSAATSRSEDNERGRARRPPSNAPELKVVYLDHCAELSGGEIALARLLEALSEVDAHVILGEDGPLRPLLEEVGVTVEVFRLDEEARTTTRNQVNRGFHSVVLAVRVFTHAWRLSFRIRKARADVVHTNSLKSAVYGSLAGWMANVPVVCHLRDRLATDYMSSGGARMMRLVMRMLPSAVIANSMETMSTLAPATTALRVFGAVAYDPVPSHAGAGDARNGNLVIGMVGRLSRWKGQHVFIEAFSRAFAEGGAVGVIVGSAMFGEGVYEEELRQQIVDLGLEERVKLVGFTKNVAGYLNQFDILVHASVIPEPFGQVVAEGMSAGLPVIASDAGGPSEVIANDVTGLLFPPGDVGALAAAMLDLADSPQKRLALGAAARIKSAEFRPDRIAEQVMAIYRVLAPDSSARRTSATPRA